MKLLPVLIFFSLLLPAVTLASEIAIRPFLIDATMVPRESLKETVVLTSDYPVRTAVIYATVNEITVGPDGEVLEFVPPVMSDRSDSITSWIEISRGRIELPAGEVVELPVNIKVHPLAQPGEYHAFIGFVETKKRDTAETVARAGDADGIVVKVTVADERVDSMRISSMSVNRFITSSDGQQVEITVENSGELDAVPGGEVIFYDNRGKEVTALPFNTEGVTVTPDQSKTFLTNIPLDVNLGKFKANANLSYGENQQASLFDSTSFYMLPIYYLYAGIGLLLLLLLVLFLLMRRGVAAGAVSEVGDDVPVFIRDGHKPQPKDHDIDLT